MTFSKGTVDSSILSAYIYTHVSGAITIDDVFYAYFQSVLKI